MAVQSASASGHHNIIVQAAGDNIHVQVGLPRLKLVPVAARLRGRARRDIDLLDPAYQSVPIVGREADRQFLLDWLSTEPKIAITAVVGRGGSGKTRLAFDLLERLPEEWQGGLLTAEEAKRFIAQENLSDWSWQKPTLVVVDYAALMAETLATWFSELSDHAAPTHALRILLLERHANAEAGWYHDLADGSWHGRAVRELFSPAEPRTVAALDQIQQRRAVLKAGLSVALEFSPAANAASVIPDTGQDQWFDQRLAADQWADPLLLLMAAVVAASDGIPAALKLSRPDLAKTLASRELDRVRKSVEDRSAKDLLVHLYGCITLCGGLSRDDAGNIAEGEFAALRKQYPGGPGQAVDDLARLLGARDWLSALTPDLLGEALLLAAFDGVLGGAVTTRVAPIAPVQVAATLIRSAQDFAHYGEARPLEWLQALVAKGQQGPDLLSAIQEALPGDTLVLRQLGLDVTDSLVRSLAQTPEPHSTGVQTTLSRLWNNLSNRQSDMGMRTEALASIAQAVRIRQELAEANSDVFLPDLATAMNNLALRQSGLGQRKEALASISAVVRYYRALVAANQNTFLSDLARSLHNLAINQTDMGLHNEALASISEAVHIRRALATADPDAFLPNLARSLNNMGSIQSDIGQRYQALGSLGEAVRYYRVLAKAKPDAFLPDLATALNNLALRQSDMGQGVEGLASVTEAVRYYRALAKANPSAFFPELARSLNTLATLQSQMGMRMEALASIDEAVSIRRVLANTNPDAFGPDLARSIIVLVTCLAAMGKMLEARDAAAECLRLLAPFCLKYFETFGDLARAVVNDYVIRSEQLGLEPDWELLRSYMPFFKSAGSNG